MTSPSPWAPGLDQHWAVPEPPPVTPPPAEPVERDKKHKTGRTALLGLTILAAAAGGAVVGSLITASHQPMPQHNATSVTQATPEAIRAQDINLCTTYAVTNATQPKPSTTGTDVLPAAAMLRTALLENPYASKPIREAIRNVAIAYDEVMAKFAEVRPRGLAEPPVYDHDRVQAAYDTAWRVCQLDKK